MTQILGAVHRGKLFQGSDRLLSYEATDGGFTDADLRANKSLVLTTGDTTCLVGYCGTAVIDRYPTDDWLAGAILGVQSGRWREPNASIDLYAFTLHDVLRSIRRCVDNYRVQRPKAKMDREFQLTVQVIGYRVRRKRLHGFALCMEMRGQRGYDEAYLRLGVEHYHSVAILPTPWVGNDGTWNLIRDDVAASTVSPSELMHSLGRGLDRCSQRPGVGNEFIGIQLDPVNGETFLLYAQDETDQFVVSSGSVPAFWTPWMLGPGVAFQSRYYAGASSQGLVFAGRRRRRAMPLPGYWLKLPEIPRDDGDPIALISQSPPPGMYVGPSGRSLAVPHLRRAAVHLAAGEHTVEMRGKAVAYTSRRQTR